ncbi:zinc-binding dehydrogenase [Microdochium bolleyi]|uniref:Zinc-binding dehydrogenase n=1 Tax=Microdochium bolleyi TaxID=196109 RepID=A0A136IST6_9PEZI|nr:zinc-binding dehydrogenase [Microdochium bolleyi]
MAMKALVTASPKTVAVRSDVPIPVLRQGEILVKVHYAAQNPTDWKGVPGKPPGRVVGCDFAGTVADANGSSQWAVGQRVAGWVHGGSADPDRGAFAEYLATEPSLVFPVPDSVSLEAASTVSLAVATAVQALFQRLGLPQPGSSSAGSSDKKTQVLIYGGTSSVGLYAVQLAKMAGLRVIATGSARNHDLLRSLGADETVDYNDADWVEKVRSLTNDDLRYALDTISEGGSIESVASAISTAHGGHVMCLLPWRGAKLPEDVAARVKVESTIAYTVFEKPLKGMEAFDYNGGVTTEDRRFWEEHGLKKLPGWLESGELKPNPVKILGGLEAVPEGFKLHQEGKVRVEKIVYKIA